MKRYNFSQETVVFPDIHRNEIMRKITPGPMTESESGEWVRHSDHEDALELALANTVEGRLAKVVKMLETKK